MKGYNIGMMAKSLAGHDKDKIYMVYGLDDQYVYLVDGCSRTLDRPKKKKRKHIQIDYTIPEWIQGILENGKKIENSDVIKARRDYGRK